MLKFLKKTSTTLALLTLIGSNVVSAESAGDNPNIDSSIQGQDRIVMESVMQNLTPEEQENVIYIDGSGNVYANKPELKQEVLKVKNLHDNVFQDDKGKGYVYPQQTECSSTDTSSTEMSSSSTEMSSSSTEITPLTASYPSCTGGTGPYRRVYSKPSYSWSTAYAHLPGGSEISDNNGNTSGDTAFVYMGGWGNSGGAVDAGFQHSSTYDNWAPMLQVNGQPYPQTPRFKSNQDVFIKFWVSNTNEVSMYVSGYDTTNTKISRTYVVTANGFSTTGGNIIKRMTSIGQISGQENLNSGSYIHNVHWYSTYIGTSSTSNHAWTSTDQATDSNSGYCSYTSSVVSVQYVNAGEETDNINL